MKYLFLSAILILSTFAAVINIPVFAQTQCDTNSQPYLIIGKCPQAVCTEPLFGTAIFATPPMDNVYNIPGVLFGDYNTFAGLATNKTVYQYTGLFASQDIIAGQYTFYLHGLFFVENGTYYWYRCYSWAEYAEPTPVPETTTPTLILILAICMSLVIMRGKLRR